MGKSFFFENINILMGSNATVIKDNLLIIDGKIEAFGNKAKEEALKKNIKISNSGIKEFYEGKIAEDILNTLKKSNSEKQLFEE